MSIGGYARWGISAGVIAVVALQTYAVLEHPFCNWDRLPYVACALRMDGLSSDEAHARTYALARRRARPEEWQDLIEGTGSPAHRTYRRDLYRNADHFRQQLP